MRIIKIILWGILLTPAITLIVIFASAVSTWALINSVLLLILIALLVYTYTELGTR